MVHESPLEKAKSMTGMTVVLGVVFTLVGISQLMTQPTVHGPMVFLGLCVAFIGMLAFRWVCVHGRNHLSNKRPKVDLYAEKKLYFKRF